MGRNIVAILTRVPTKTLVVLMMLQFLWTLNAAIVCAAISPALLPTAQVRQGKQAVNVLLATVQRRTFLRW